MDILFVRYSFVHKRVHVSRYQYIKALSSNPADGEVHSIQYYVIKFVTDCGLLWILMFPSTTQLTTMICGNWNIVESGVKCHKTNQNQTNQNHSY